MSRHYKNIKLMYYIIFVNESYEPVLLIFLFS